MCPYVGVFRLRTVIIKLYLIKLRILFKHLTNQIIVTTIWDVIIVTETK
jgi:hypothetical protein